MSITYTMTVLGCFVLLLTGSAVMTKDTFTTAISVIVSEGQESIIPSAPKGMMTKAQYEKLSFAINKVAQPAIGVLGMTGNILGIIVFTHQESKLTSSIRVYLTALCATDLIFLTTSLYESVLEYMQPYYPQSITMLQAYGRKFVQPITKGARASSSFLVVVIAMERFLAITYPLGANKSCFKRCPFVPITIVIACNIIFCTFIALSFEPVQQPDSTWKAFISSFAKQGNFLKVYGIVAEVLYQLLPAFLVSSFNIGTISQLYIARRTRKAMSQGRPTGNAADAQATRMLLGVAIFFNICVIPSFVLGLMRLIRPDWRVGKERLLISTATLLGKLLSRINSSSNIFVFICTSGRFREIFISLFKKGEQKQNSVTEMSFVKSTSD